MIIDEITHEVRKFQFNKRGIPDIKIAIYMELNFFLELKQQIYRSYSMASLASIEFGEHDTILGYTVYKISDSQHPKFLIVEIK